MNLYKEDSIYCIDGETLNRFCRQITRLCNSEKSEKRDIENIVALLKTDFIETTD